MSAEHSPRPGANWDTRTVRTVRTEQVVADTALDGLNDPQSLRLNRRQRRAQQHANRRKGNQR